MTLQPCGIRKALELVFGATDISIKKQYPDERYGFFSDKSGATYYFATTDTPRLIPALSCLENGEIGLMYRTAKDRKDFTGGYNTWDFNKKLHEIGYKLMTK